MNNCFITINTESETMILCKSDIIKTGNLHKTLFLLCTNQPMTVQMHKEEKMAKSENKDYCPHNAVVAKLLGADDNQLIGL